MSTFSASPVKVVVTGARGPRGLRGEASGPLGAGSVDSETIADSPAEQAAILEKLTYAGTSVADQLDAASANRAAQSRSVQPGSALAVSAIDFAQGFVPGETPSNVLSLSGGATGSVIVSAGADAFRAVSVLAAYDQPAKRALTPVSFAEGTLSFQVLRGADNDHSHFMLMIAAQDGRSRAVWSTDGTSLSYGWIAADGSLAGDQVYGTLAGAFVGGANQLVNIELMTPPIYPGLTWYVRSWVDGGTRPTDDQAMKAAYPTGEPAGAAGNKINQGRVAIASIGANPALIARVRAIDGQRGSKLTGKAYLRGRWFSRFDGGRLVMASTRGAASMRSLVTGTNDVAIDYVGTPSGSPVVLDAFVNGQRVGDPIVLNVGAGLPGTKGVVLGMDTTAINQLEFRVRGVDVFSNMWYRGAGALIEDIRPSLSAGRLAPWEDQRPKALFVGDSITAGNVARGTSANPLDYGGDIAWPVLSAEAAGWQAIVSAYGGTGATVGIADGNTSPSALRHAFSYMEGRPIEGVTENIRCIVVNLGTNDASQGVSAAAFKAGYKQLLARLLRENPGTAKLLAMYPLNQAFSAQIFEVVGEMQDPRVLVFDTSSWTGITYTDGLHPNVAGHARVADYVTPVLRTALAGAMA
jgi:lysophospholipase L1-like esterase